MHKHVKKSVKIEDNKLVLRLLNATWWLSVLYITFPDNFWIYGKWALENF